MDQFLYGLVITMGVMLALTGALKVATWVLRAVAVILERLTDARGDHNNT